MNTPMRSKSYCQQIQITGVGTLFLVLGSELLMVSVLDSD